MERTLDADVIVIGAGHNGMVAANYLADAGHEVLVVEAADKIGGMSSSGPTIAGAPEHIINQCSVDPFFWEIFPPSKDLELHRYGLQMVEVDPAYAYLHPDGSSIVWWRDPKKTADDIRHFSAADAEAYLELMRLLFAFMDLSLPLGRTNPTRPAPRQLAASARGAIKHRKRLKDVAWFAFSSATEVIDERFEHPVVGAALHAIAAGILPNNWPGTATMLGMPAGFHMFGGKRPVGGMQALPNALRARLEARKGRILTSAPVLEITVRANRVTGLVLADGRELRARRAVLAACDPRTALGRLLPAGTLPEAMQRRVNAIPVTNANIGQMKVDVALKGRLDLSRHNKWRRDGLDLRIPSHVIGTPEGLERAFARCGAGLMPAEEDIGFWNCIPTALDPSQAPEGKDNLYIHCSTVPYAPEEGWKNLRSDAAQSILNRAAAFYGGLVELEIGRQFKCNEDIAEFRGATGGAVLHVDAVFSRMGPARPALGLGGYKTPVNGLYLGASGSHPGGGVTGAPGYLGAKEVIRDLRRERRSAKGGSDCDEA